MQGSLATKLRVLRAERGLTLRQAAERMRVRPATLSDIEHGRSQPHDVTLAKIAKAYGVPLGDLLEERVPLGKAPRASGQGDGTKGPDPAVWRPKESRPKPPIPESAGKRIHVEVQDDLSDEPARVTITETPFLDVARELREGKLSPEDAWIRILRRQGSEDHERSA